MENEERRAAIPYSYFGSTVGYACEAAPFRSGRNSIVPDYALGPHTASLGLAYVNQTALGPPFTAGMFVGQHGSGNRRPRSGYKVIFVPFADGKPSGIPGDVLTDFVGENDNAVSSS
jgi:glucose/arabinose dehydrogenase